MLEKVSVLMPYKPDYGVRDNLFKWVQSFYKNMMPEVEICIGECNSELFNRSQAINNAAKIATRDVFAIIDTDVVYDPQVLINAVQLLDEHAWVIPYNKILDLSQFSTEALLGTDAQWPLPFNVEFKDRFELKDHKPVGAFAVLSRANFNLVGGFDERFAGWGREDNAFRDAMNTLCGPYRRINKYDLYHLWHPRTEAKGNPNFENNHKLYKEYAKRRGNADEMRKWIKARRQSGS
ncbi:galactosyltransferase-related protein [Peribacillus glennii]|uniref:Glycosyltransferase n=1 Tax=Peribacillus glennii TaxID=2303991 RepID=A0A372L7S5_9BACI|nr:galactosyltransferase-related protein [Peribacillus glennii]RFU61301.1 glycosyltransferase [Peribacillus glennii]